MYNIILQDYLVIHNQQAQKEDASVQVNVALVQQKARIFPNEDSFKERIFHFMQRARATGILAEAPSLNEEAFLVAKWDFTRLVELMAKTDLQVSRDRRLDIIKKYYQSL